MMRTPQAMIRRPELRPPALVADATDLNLVLWRWGDAAPCRLALINDEGRLD